MAITANKSGSRQDFASAIDMSVNPLTKEKEKNEPKAKKGKGGRPSAGKVKKMPLSIPEELYDDVEVAATLFYKGNKTAYINALIKKDLEENGEKYKEFKKMIER